MWKGFGPSVFSPAREPETGQPYTYATDGFEATSYQLSTDQFGTQLDPPAHWAPEYAAIDELPPTFAIRKLVVISIARQVREELQLRPPGLRHQALGARATAASPPGASCSCARTGRRTGRTRRWPR